MDNSGKETKRFGRRKIHERSKKRRQRRGQHDEKEGANEAQTKRRAPKHRQTTSKPNRQRERDRPAEEHTKLQIKAAKRGGGNHPDQQ